MPGDHRPLRRAVIDEHAGARRLEAQRHFLAGIDVGERAAAQRAGRSVEVDVVVERVGRRIDQRELEIVALVDDHQRAGDRAVVGEGVDLRPVVVDHVLLLDDRHLEGDDLRTAARRLLVRMDEGRRDELDFAARQIGGLLRHRRQRLQHGGRARGGAGGQKQIAAVEHGWLLGVRRFAGCYGAGAAAGTLLAVNVSAGLPRPPGSPLGGRAPPPPLSATRGEGKARWATGRRRWRRRRTARFPAAF